MELRKSRTQAVRATRGPGRKGKIMQIKGKKQERFRPRSSRLLSIYRDSKETQEPASLPICPSSANSTL